MVSKISLDGEEYDVADLSEPAQKAYQSHRFTNKKLLELNRWKLFYNEQKIATYEA